MESILKMMWWREIEDVWRLLTKRSDLDFSTHPTTKQHLFKVCIMGRRKNSLLLPTLDYYYNLFFGVKNKKSDRNVYANVLVSDPFWVNWIPSAKSILSHYSCPGCHGCCTSHLSCPSASPGVKFTAFSQLMGHVNTPASSKPATLITA